MQNKYTIHIIDDDTFLLDMYTLKFKEKGFKVDSSSSGEEAIGKLREGASPNVILFDIVMPGVDGFELLDTIKKEKLAKGALLIALSNQGEERDIEIAKEHGTDEYIVKADMVPSEVLETVSTIITKHLTSK